MAKGESPKRKKKANASQKSPSTHVMEKELKGRSLGKPAANRSITGDSHKNRKKYPEKGRIRRGELSTPVIEETKSTAGRKETKKAKKTGRREDFARSTKEERPRHRRAKKQHFKGGKVKEGSGSAMQAAAKKKDATKPKAQMPGGNDGQRKKTSRQKRFHHR